MPVRTPDATALSNNDTGHGAIISDDQRAKLRLADLKRRRQHQVTLVVVVILPLCTALAGLLGYLAMQCLSFGTLTAHVAPSLEIARKLLPLYSIVGLGIVLGRLLEMDRTLIGTVLVRGVSPVVFFGAMASAPIAPHDLALPALFFLLSTAVCLAAFGLARAVLVEREARLSAFLAGSANVGYFGVPAALAVLPADALGTYLLALLEFAVYENTVGYYMMARSGAGMGDALRCVLTLPAVHAVALGFAANWVGGSGGTELHALWEAFKGCYVVLGMLALGLGLARLPGLMDTLHFALSTILVRFAVWPAAAAVVVALHASWGEPLGPALALIAPLFAALPCATSGAVFAAELDLEPGKASACVLISTVLALLTVPMVAMLPVLLPVVL